MWVTGRGQEEIHVEIEVVTWPLMLVNTTSLACRVMDCPLVLMRGWAAAMCVHCSGGGAQTEKWRANAKRHEHTNMGFRGKSIRRMPQWCKGNRVIVAGGGIGCELQRFMNEVCFQSNVVQCSAGISRSA